MKKQRSAPSSPVTTLYIKNMVCNRCIKVVGDELKALGLAVRSITLGEAVVEGEVDPGAVKEVLERSGFELIEDKRVKTIEKIKQAVLKLVRRDAEQDPVRLKQSEFIAREVGKDYHTLSTLFSSVENVTIEQYVILQRIEYAKELLKYGEKTLSEISYTLGYSSVQHLSNQFKKVTGMTPREFKKNVANTRKTLDAVGRTA